MGLPTAPQIDAEARDISVVIVNYNTAHLLGELFATLEASRGALKLQVIVVDNASRDGSVDVLRTKFPNVELIENPTNVGFGRANNQALPRIPGVHVLDVSSVFPGPDPATYAIWRTSTQRNLYKISLP